MESAPPPAFENRYDQAKNMGSDRPHKDDPSEMTWRDYALVALGMEE
jgi:hypothetical protein